MPESLPPDVRDLLALALVPGLGPRLTAALLAHFGSAAAVRSASAEQLRQVSRVGDKLARSFAAALRSVDLDAEERLLTRHGVRLLALGTPTYPASLALIPDPPHLVFQRGQLDERDANAVAIVGSRHGTRYGLRAAERIAADLARAGVTVVSGLARGIDGAAHRGALQAGGRTVAVLAGGLSRIYPPEHTDLAEEVAAAGALLTEATMALSPQAGMFPARNRIISGLARGVVVVEAGEKSGALITVTHAAEQGREAFAVPGPIDSEASAGTNALIRKGAVLVRGADDILEELNGIASLLEPSAVAGMAARGSPTASAPRPPTGPAEPPPGLDETQRRVWDFLADGPRHTDEMAQTLRLPVPQLTTTLMMLEMKKAVRRLPGNRYERC